MGDSEDKTEAESSVPTPTASKATSSSSSKAGKVSYLFIDILDGQPVFILL